MTDFSLNFPFLCVFSPICDRGGFRAGILFRLGGFMSSSCVIFMFSDTIIYHFFHFLWLLATAAGAEEWLSLRLSGASSIRERQ